MQQLVCEGAYGDSVLQLLPALADGTWKLLTPELGTPLKNKPTMPLTALQKRWLKTLLLDEKISLFFSDEEIARQQAALQSVEPLCRPKQFVFFDRFVDGDAYTNPKYRVNFREILHAVREKRYLNASTLCMNRSIFMANSSNAFLSKHTISITFRFYVDTSNSYHPEKRSLVVTISGSSAPSPIVSPLQIKAGKTVLQWSCPHMSSPDIMFHGG